MRHVLWNIDDAIKPWACSLFGKPPEVYGSDARFAAIVDESGKGLAAAVYTDYYPVDGTLQLHFAAESPRWATREIIREILGYAFETCGVQKLWTATPQQNERALKLNYGLGFKREAILQRHFGRGTAAVICRMYHEDYIRLWGGRKAKNGKKRTKSKNT